MSVKTKIIYLAEAAVAVGASIATSHPEIAAGGGVVIAATFIALHRKI